jgi:hypothetical protein
LSDQAHVIILDSINDFQRGQVHQIVKSNTERWWHWFPDVWIVVADRGTEFWRDLIGEVVPTVGSGSVLVMHVDARWAGFGTPEEFAWLDEILQDKPAPPKPLPPKRDRA